MITILTTTKYKNQIIETINSVERLDELVAVKTDKTEADNNLKKLIVEDNNICIPLDWFDTEPPYAFPDTIFNANNLLAFVFYKLGNHQKAFKYLSDDTEIYHHFLIATHLSFGYGINEEQIAFLKQTSAHNLAIVYNFGALNTKVEKKVIQNAYENAIKLDKTDTLRIYSTKHYANLLLDSGMPNDAEKLVRSIRKITISNAEKNAMNHLLSIALKAQVALPYDDGELKEIAQLQEECIDYYEHKNLKVNAGLIYIAASEIANFQDNYIKSKDLINKAILYFKEENIPEFLGEATLQKATLLYTWSKNGSPQYYKPAINTFQNALKVFKRDLYPQKFADIHHNLALIYSEIQVSEKEKPIWTAFCASSFKDALKFYNKDEFPYQFAMISHNYATALMGFPEAKLHNNMNKAFGLFEEALSIRTADKYPFERALTLLNQLELYWLIHNEDQNDEQKKLNEMLAKTNEIFTLVNDKNLLEKAKTNLEEIKKLKTIIN